MQSELKSSREKKHTKITIGQSTKRTYGKSNEQLSPKKLPKPNLIQAGFFKKNPIERSAAISIYM